MKKRKFFGIFALILFIAACSNPAGSDYNGDTNGVEFTETIINGNKKSTTYTLTVSHPVARAAVGDDFSLKVSREGFNKTSSGKIVSATGTDLVYQPKYKDAKAFTVGFYGTKLTHVTGTITFDDGTSELGPGSFANGGGGGGGSDGGSAATGISVTITQPAPVTRGTKQLFTAIVSGTNNPEQKAVTWQVKGGFAKGTSISPDGLLTVDESEPSTTLTVTATSTFDPKKSGSATVTLSGLLNVITPALELSMISSFTVLQNSDLTLAVNIANKDKIDDQHNIPGIGGNISYQWYSSTKDSSQDKTVINGATGISYKIPTAVDGILYYWVEVKNSIDIKDPEVVDTNVITVLAGPITVTVTKIPTGTSASIIILQVGAAKDGDISHSFVELYNTGDMELNLSGYSLQYAAGFSTTGNGAPDASNKDTDGKWNKIDLSGTIKGHSSFLILGKKGTGTNPALSIKDGYGDINNSGFELNNRALKVVLMSTTTSLSVKNPFNTDGKGATVAGYIDMVGALNTSGTDNIQGFEKNPITNLNKNTGQRRKSLTDTNDNKADFERVDYRYAKDHQKEDFIAIWKPKNQKNDGVWNPILTSNDRPDFSDFKIDPSLVTPGKPVTVSVTITSLLTSTTIKTETVVLKYKVNNGTENSLPMTPKDGNVYSAVIPAQSVAGAVVTYTISATNNRNEAAVTTTKSYTVISENVDYTKLKLNEVSGVGDDPDKFYELKNIGTEDIPLANCKIYYNANSSTGGTLPTGDGSLTWTGLDTQSIKAGGLYSLIGRNKPGSFTTGLTAERILIITLKDPAGNVIDKCVRSKDTGDYAIKDKSFSRIPDGTGVFYFTTPTPDTTNGTSTIGLTKLPDDPPVISEFGRNISSVTPTDTVTVSATVTTTTSTITAVVLQWTLNGSAESDITMTLVGNKYSATIPAQSEDAVVAYKVSATNSLGETDSTSRQSYTVASVSEPPPPPLLILQAGASTNGAISHNFVELYNAGNDTVNLSGYSLQYANGANPTDSAWTVINLTGTLPKNHSYLILGNKWSGTRSDTAKFGDIADNSGDINASFSLSNNGFKVVLMSNQIKLTVENPFNIDGSGKKAPGYVDMLGAVNGTSNPLHGFETAVMTKISKQQTARRTSLTDTDNNETDFTNIDYRTTGNVKEYQYPKNSAYGSWDPFVEPPPSEGSAKLMILQANTYGNNNGGAAGFARSLVELYNNTNAAINLTTGNYYLHIGSNTTWINVIKLDGIIPAKSSFLIVDNTPTASSNTNSTPKAALPTADQEAAFVITNSNFKIALLKNQSSTLTVNNPFGESTLSSDYVDMLGCGTANGYETTAAQAASRPQALRRTSLNDTDDNSKDFARVDYTGTSSITNDQLYKYWPRNTADGGWNPITGLPKIDPVIP